MVPEYRLAPEHPYPAGLDDVMACYEYLLAQGVAAASIVVAGDSAGGNLTLALALRLKDEGTPRCTSNTSVFLLKRVGGTVLFYNPFVCPSKFLYG
jgi:acetyl esterase/lipase